MDYYSSNIIELCYVSQATQSLNQRTLLRLINDSRKWNDQHNITSVLFYKNRRFAQIIEGTMRDIDLVCRRISNSTWHCKIEHLETRQIDRRSIPDYPLRFFGNNGVDRSFPEISGHLLNESSDKASLIRQIRIAASRSHTHQGLHAEYL